MSSAKDVASLILTLCEERGIGVSNLKLQKLMYYTQGYHLAVSGKTLFEDDLMAWEHGPVVPSVWLEYRDNGSSYITPLKDMDITSFSDASIGVVNYVLDTFGQMGAWSLRERTHSEEPWLNHYDQEKDRVDNCVITTDEVDRFFKRKISSEQDKKFAHIMDNLHSEPAASVPNKINTAQEFSRWIESL